MPMENTVIPLFFNSFIFVPKDPQVNVGFMELLPQAYSQTKFGSALHFGLLAVSFFSVASWTGQRSLLYLAQSTFVQALRKTRESLQETDMDENINEALISVLLLDLFEVCQSAGDKCSNLLLIWNRTLLRERTDSFLPGIICAGPLR